MSTGEPNPTSDRRTVVAVFLAGVAVFLVLYETQGLIPAIREAYGIDAPTASLTVSATNVAMACFLIPFSLLASRIGHARQIAGGVILAAALALVLPFMPNPELLIAVRFLQGVAIASVPATAMAYLSPRLPPAVPRGDRGLHRRQHDRRSELPPPHWTRRRSPRLARRARLHRRRLARPRPHRRVAAAPRPHSACAPARRPRPGGRDRSRRR